jgi:hypothetical protein
MPRKPINKSEVIRRINKVLSSPSVRGHITYSIFHFLHKNFLEKSQGERGLWGPAWKPLSPARIAYKRKHYPHNADKINIATGRLITSLEPHAVSESQGYLPSPDQEVTQTPRTIRIRIKVSYAKHVNKRRRFIPTKDELKSTIKNTIASEIKKAFKS